MNVQWIFFGIFALSFGIAGYLLRKLIEMIGDYRNAKFVRKFHTGYNDHPERKNYERFH